MPDLKSSLLTEAEPADVGRFGISSDAHFRHGQFGALPNPRTASRSFAVAGQCQPTLGGEGIVLMESMNSIPSQLRLAGTGRCL